MISTLQLSPEEDLQLSRDLAPILRRLYPGFSCCGGCGVPWPLCKTRAVMTSKHSGTFATCKRCWETLSLEEIKQCYTETYKDQSRDCEMPHTLEHLLNCVEEEFKKTRNDTTNS